MKKYNLSDRCCLQIIKDFLAQTLTKVKMSDSEGFYVSNEIDTLRGSPQGQIGSDFLFAMINEGIDPEIILGEVYHRLKYVDDFSDIISAIDTDILFKSLRHNERVLMRQATSVGLKMNESKTQILTINVPESDRDSSYVYVTQVRTLGFTFEAKIFKKSMRISADPEADNLIYGLNSCTNMTVSYTHLTLPTICSV